MRVGIVPGKPEAVHYVYSFAAPIVSANLRAHFDTGRKNFIQGRNGSSGLD
jgi:hypothetical protein